MSRLSFSEVKKARDARRRACASTGQNALLVESERAGQVISKPQPFPELAELLSPDIMVSLQESLHFLDGISALSLVRDGSATIRRARDGSGTLVILKQTTLTVDNHGRVRQRERLERFCREVRVLSHEAVIYNDNIVDVVSMQWDAVGTGQLLTIALECADLGNLAEFQLSQWNTTWAQKRKICLDVAAGLSMLHDCGISHGDLKPENILIFYGPKPSWEDEWDITDGFLAKLCDFGSSHFNIWNLDSKDVTLYGATPPFTAPEYDFHNRSCLPSHLLSRFDIYVFGMLVWRVALGSEVPLGILASVLSDESLREEGEICRLQRFKCFSDDRFLQLAKNSLSSIPVENRSFYEKIFQFTLRFRTEDRARTVKEIPCLLEDEDEVSSAIVAVDYPSGTAPELFLRPTDLGIVGADFGVMPELFSLPSPTLHCSIFRSLENMTKDTTLDHTKRTQANLNAGLCAFAGIGTTKSFQLALQYLTEAAYLGCMNIRAIIYRLYQACGRPLPESIPIRKWLEDGVRSGSIIASEDLISCHGLPQDDHSIQWIRTHYNESNSLQGPTPLFSICRSGGLEDILAACAKGTLCDNSEPSCLHYIIGHDHPNVDSLIPALVKCGSPVDSQSRYSFQQAFGVSHYGYLSKEGAPLHWAVACNNARAVTALIDSGADPYLCNTTGLSPAHVASYNHQYDLLEIILTRSKYVWKPRDKFEDSLTVQALNQTVFHHVVCTRGDPNSLFRVLRLLRKYVEPEDIHDVELLSLVIESRCTVVLQFLLDEWRLDPNVFAVHSGAKCCWPLHIAVKSAHLASFNVLVQHHLDLRQVQLAWAVSSTSVEDEIVSIIERLVELGVSVNTADRKGSYPLHIAIRHGKIDVVKALLRCGANKEHPHAISSEIGPFTALGQLLYMPSLEATPSILKLLLNPEEEMGQPSSHCVCPTSAESSLHIICRAPSSIRDDGVCLSCFRILWKSYSDKEKMAYLNAFSTNGQTPLHCAVFAGNFLCVEELVQLGADVKLKSQRKQQTPLEIACFLASDEVLSHWQGQSFDMQVYQKQMEYIIRVLKLKEEIVHGT